MPTKLFNELPEDKKQRITQAALEEFAANRFDDASTNTIVKNCGISKGSLFKYFESKEDLYFYLTDTVAAKMAQETEGMIKDLPEDVFERIAAYSAIEISYYTEHPAEGKLLINLASERDNNIAEKIEARYGDRSQDIYGQLIEGTGLDKSRSDILKWVLECFNKEFLEKGGGSDYMESLAPYLEILRKGI